MLQGVLARPRRRRKTLLLPDTSSNVWRVAPPSPRFVSERTCLPSCKIVARSPALLLPTGFSAPIERVRRLLTILLLAVFSLPLITPLLALGAAGDLSLPACCRRSGKHHCMMAAANTGESSQHSHTLTTIPEKCPYAPGLLAATHPDVLSVPSNHVLIAAVISQTSGVAQTESKWRISRDRSRQKRGPPSLLG